jgi:hypothetical protein
MAWTDAGGTKGGAGSFLGGAALLVVGLWLLLRNILVTSSFSWGMGLFPFQVGGSSQAVPAGLFVVTALVGFVLIFRNARSIVGWMVLAGSIGALVLGVILSLHFLLRPMSLWELLGILGVLGAGMGLLLRSFRPGA